MALHNKEMNLVLSSDAKPRLKWTQELHRRFVDAVNHLGGPDKATPKSLMRVMDIEGLTLYHLKSHLQKYRLGKSQQSHTDQQIKQEENAENNTSQVTDKISTDPRTQEEINESLQVAQALQMQMDVQRKLHEQIEVQRHLQLRIEAQGKYLQSVLQKAQDTLSGYSSCSADVQKVKARLSQLASMVNSGCPSSVVTECDDSIFKIEEDKSLLGHNCNGYSIESSLTSSDSSGRKDEIETKIENHKRKRNPVMLSLMEMHSSRNRESDYDQSGKEKRSKTGDGSRGFDLNFKSASDSGAKGVIDLNCSGVELFSASFSV